MRKNGKLSLQYSSNGLNEGIINGGRLTSAYPVMGQLNVAAMVGFSGSYFNAGALSIAVVVGHTMPFAMRRLNRKMPFAIEAKHSP